MKSGKNIYDGVNVFSKKRKGESNMAILVLWSSPNTDGLTAAVKDKVVDEIHAAGKEAVEIHLNKKKVDLCRACERGWGKCHSEGKCILRDEFQEIYDAIRQSDAVVFITPVYWHDISENLKAFLDRLRRCETFHNHYLADKRCMLIACAGGTGNGTIECLDQMEKTMRHMGLVPLERLPITRFSCEYMIPAFAEAGKMFAEHYADWLLKPSKAEDWYKKASTDGG